MSEKELEMTLSGPVKVSSEWLYCTHLTLDRQRQRQTSSNRNHLPRVLLLQPSSGSGYIDWLYVNQ